VTISSLLFPPGSACQSGPGGVRCAVGGCGAPEASCDKNLPYSFVCDATQLRSGLNCAALGLGCVPASEGISAHCG
jgi:hypothetical protein